MDYFVLILVIVIFVLVIFVHYKISTRMGFSKSTSIVMGIAGLTGLVPFAWWLMKWPNEKDNSSTVEEL